MEKREKLNYNSHEYEITIEDNIVSVSVNKKTVYKIIKDMSVTIKDIFDEKSFFESQNLMVQTAKTDINNGIIEKCAKKMGII